MDDFKEKFEEEIKREHEIYVRRLEKENQKLRNSIDNLFVNLNIVAILTTDIKAAGVIKDLVTITRQDLTI